MLDVLVVFSVLVVVAGQPTSAPVSDLEFEAFVSQEIKGNSERLGAYEVEYVRTDEDLVVVQRAPSGEISITQAPAPIASRSDEASFCVWKEDPTSLATSYREERVGKKIREQLYDAETYYTLVSPREFVQRSVRGMDRLDRLHHRDRNRDERVKHPLDLLFPDKLSGHCPSWLGPYVLVQKPEGAQPGILAVSTERFVRSADAEQDVQGVKAVQFNLEVGRWKPIDTRKFVPLQTLRNDEWVFTKTGVSQRWWLDPAHGYLPIKTEVYTTGPGVDGVVQTTEILRFMQVAPKTWFPVSGVITWNGQVGTFKNDKDMHTRTPRVTAPIRRTTIEVTRVLCGKSFAKDEFKPDPNDKVEMEKPRVASEDK